MFHNKTHPLNLGESDVRKYLTRLARGKYEVFSIENQIFYSVMRCCVADVQGWFVSSLVLWFFSSLVYLSFILTIDKIFMGLCFPTAMLVSLRDHRSRLQRDNSVQIIDIFGRNYCVEDFFVVRNDEYSLPFFLLLLQYGKHADYAFEI